MSVHAPKSITRPSTGAILAAPIAMALASQLPACASALPIGFDEEAPGGRIQAIVRAVRIHDTARIPDLIAQLDSDDPAVRLFAIRALEVLTNQTLGYHHADTLAARDQAIDRWVQWFQHRDAPADAPLAQGPTP